MKTILYFQFEKLIVSQDYKLITYSGFKAGDEERIQVFRMDPEKRKMPCFQAVWDQKKNELLIEVENTGSQIRDLESMEENPLDFQTLEIYHSNQEAKFEIDIVYFKDQILKCNLIMGFL